VAAALEYLSHRRGIALAYDAREAGKLEGSSDPQLAAVALGVNEQTAADLVVYPAQGWVIDSLDLRGAGTTHGTPWDYDREVPVLFFGPGIAAREVTAVGDARQVAPTISARCARLRRARPPRLRSPARGLTSAVAGCNRRAAQRRVADTLTCWWHGNCCANRRDVAKNTGFDLLRGWPCSRRSHDG
jgi:hypothetical protein